MDRGFWLSLEAVLALCLLALLFLGFGFPGKAKPETVMVVQKESDLLAEWTKVHEIAPEEMLAQAKSLFPDNFVEIESGGRTASCCPGQGGGRISVFGLIATKGGTEKVTLSVFEQNS